MGSVMCIRDSTFDVHITAIADTLKLERVEFAPGRLKQLKEYLVEAEHDLYQGIVGSLAWTTQKVRPEMSCRCSEQQHKQSKPQICDLKSVNQLVFDLQDTPEQDLTFLSSATDWDTSTQITMADTDSVSYTHLTLPTILLV